MQLKEFMSQTGCQVTHNVDALIGVETRAVHGQISATRALKRMFRGSGFSARLIAEPCHYALVQHRLSRPPQQRPPHDEIAATDQPEVVISTGSYVPQKASASVDMVRITRADIENSSFINLQDLFRTHPHAHNSGAHENTRRGAEAASNITIGNGINLRAMKSGATLLLMDGGRVATSGSQGTFTDSTGIPLSAVESVETVPNGTAAVYGADAVGGVVHVLMRKHFSGQETTLSWGTVTDGPMEDAHLSHLMGSEGERSGGYLALEYYNRRSLPGTARAQMTSDLRRYGGDSFNSFASNPGTLIDSSGFWAIPRGQDGTQLSPSDLVRGEANERDLQEGVDALPAHETIKAYGTTHSPLFDWAELRSTASFSQRHSRRNVGAAAANLPVPESNAFYVNPSAFPGPVTVAYSFGEDLGPARQDIHVTSGSVELALSGEFADSWHLSERVRYAMERGSARSDNVPSSSALIEALADPNPATALNVFGDGSHTNPATLEAIRMSEYFSYQSWIKEVNLELGGPVGFANGHHLRIALGAHNRVESFRTNEKSEDLADGWQRYNGRKVTAGYGEVAVPIVEPRAGLRGLHELELSVAMRVEKYSDVGLVATPRLRVQMSPHPSLQFNANWATASLAPGLGAIGSGNWSTLVTVLDKQSERGSSRVLVRLGDDPGLEAESASTYTVSAAFNPTSSSGLQLAASYFSIHVIGRAATLPYSYNMLNDAGYASRITRTPSTALVDEICSSAEFAGDLPDCTIFPVAAIVDLRTLNAVSQITRGVDFAGRYKFGSADGAPALGMLGTYVTDYLISDSPANSYVDRVNTEHNPPTLRFRGYFHWQPWKLGGSVYFNYSGAYRDTASVPQRRVSHWGTVDAQVFYESGSLDEDSRLRVSLDVLNAFNTLPPFLNNSVGVAYDQENGDLTGRMVRLAVQKRF